MKYTLSIYLTGNGNIIIKLIDIMNYLATRAHFKNPISHRICQLFAGWTNSSSALIVTHKISFDINIFNDGPKIFDRFNIQRGHIIKFCML